MTKKSWRDLESKNFTPGTEVGYYYVPFNDQQRKWSQHRFVVTYAQLQEAIMDKINDTGIASNQLPIML